MPIRFFLGAYWGSRTEPATVCAQRLLVLLKQLEKIHPMLADWRRLGHENAEALRENISLSSEYLNNLIKEGSDPLFPDLGFRTGLWNGKDPSIGLKIHCGADAKTSPNNVLIDFPPVDDETETLYQSAVLMSTFDSVVEQFDPDWAFLGTREMRDRQGGFTGRPIAGWLSYIRASSQPAEQSDTGVQVSPYYNGVLLTTAPDPLSVTDAQVDAAGKILAKAIRASGSD